MSTALVASQTQVSEVDLDNDSKSQEKVLSSDMNDTKDKLEENGEDKKKNQRIGEYIIGKSIGKGTFGKVKKGVHIKTNEKVAIKILEKDKIQDVADVERVAREIHILKI